MKNLIAVGAIALFAVACGGTKPTDTIRNAVRADDDTSAGWTFTSIQLREYVEYDDPEMAQTGEFGSNILSGALAKGQEVSVDGIECGSYEVRATLEGGETCDITEESGLGPYWLCFSKHRWDLTETRFGDCEMFPALDPAE